MMGPALSTLLLAVVLEPLLHCDALPTPQAPIEYRTVQVSLSLSLSRSLSLTHTHSLTHARTQALTHTHFLTLWLWTVQVQPGITLDVAVAGSASAKDAMVLLHGYPECSWFWRGVVDPLLAGGGLQLWMPDQRGFNHSSKPNGIGRCDREGGGERERESARVVGDA